MSIVVSIPSSLPTKKVSSTTTTTIPTALSTFGRSGGSSSFASLHSPAKLSGASSSSSGTPFPRRTGGSSAYLAVRVKASSQPSVGELRTCRNCKKPFDSSQNHPRACLFHTAHYGGETKRKFESVYSGGTMDTVGGGDITQYWHCCGSKDPFDPGCEAAPHSTYDD